MLPEHIVRAAILLAAAQKRRPPRHPPRNAPMTRLPRLDGEAKKPIIGEGFPWYPIYRNPNPRRKRYS